MKLIFIYLRLNKSVTLQNETQTVIALRSRRRTKKRHTDGSFHFTSMMDVVDVTKGRNSLQFLVDKQIQLMQRSRKRSWKIFYSCLFRLKMIFDIFLCVIDVSRGEKLKKERAENK